MGQTEWNAYHTFLQSGKIEDYLTYINVKQQTGSDAGAAATGESSAYYHRRDCAADTHG